MESKQSNALECLANEQSELIILEIEHKDFSPHFGNNFVFYFKNGEPLITIGPHWPLSLCLLLSILIGTYFIYSIVMIHKNWIEQLLSVCSGLNLAFVFLMTVLKNPGINTAWQIQPEKESYNNIQKSDNCRVCNMPKLQSTVHCYDCDICVRDHDHHCPWTGKCIGEGNIMYFQLFICGFAIFFVVNLVVLVI